MITAIKRYTVTLLKHKIIRFFLVSGLNTAFGYGLFALLLFIGLHYSIALLISTICGVLFNFKTIGIIVFKNHNNRLLLNFIGVYVITYLISIAILALFNHFQISLYLGGFFLIIPMGLLAFYLNKILVFDKKLLKTLKKPDNIIWFTKSLIYNSKAKYCIYIFIIALIFRVILINSVNTEYIAPDGTGYYHLAYNLSEGNGYVMHGEKYFFREPGYPVFLSLAFNITKLLGHETGTLVFDDDFKILNRVPEIIVAKYLQAIVDALSCVLLFLILTGVIKLKFALIIALSFCIHFHYAWYTTHLLRETLQSFFALAMCYSLLQYFKKDSNFYLILTGFSWGILNLIFYPNLVFAISIPVFILIYKKNFYESIKPSVVIIAMMIITASPWLYRSYSNFPDIRILKSFGSSLTSEYLSYNASLSTAEYYGLIGKGEANSIFKKDLVDNVSEAERFRLYWDGTISAKRDSINNQINEPIFSKRKLIKLAHHAKNISPPTFAKAYLNNRPLIGLFLLTIIAIFSLLSLIGIIKFFRQMFFINIVLITYLSVFFVIASESRRMLPIQPFLFTYCILGVFYIFFKYYKKMSDNEIKILLLKN